MKSYERGVGVWAGNVYGEVQNLGRTALGLVLVS